MSEEQTPADQKAAPAAASSDDYFNSGRIRVIGLILAAVVAVGALGGLLGVVFDPDDEVDDEQVVQPGAAAAIGGVGKSVAARHPVRSLLGLDDTTSPSPVGTVSATDSATPTETGSPTPTDTGTPAPSPSPDDGSTTVTLGNGVQIWMPPGWHVDRQDDIQVNFSDGKGNWGYAFSATQYDATTDASSLIIDNINGLLPPDIYTQQRYSEIGAIEPFGSVVSCAYMDYEALVADNQGSISLHGQIYAGVRQDGTGLVVLVEHTPAEDWNNGFEQVKDVVNVTFTRFSGLG